MGLMNLLKKLFGGGEAPFVDREGTIYTEDLGKDAESIDEIYSLWDFLEFQENTQASHVVSVIGFDEWVSMDEIRRRVRELFGASYKNERSLYPYIKTLVDCGLLEASSAGGKRKWRKRDLIIKLGSGVKEGETTRSIIIEKKRKKRVN